LSFESIRNRIAKLGPKPPGWQRKPTTAEARQELDRLLAKMENMPVDPNPPEPTPAEARQIAWAQAECDRMLAEMDKRIADDEREAARPWSERGKP
jgi:hypothetical protein